MNLPVNLFMWVIAALPIVILLLLMVKFQWGAAEAAPIGLFAALIIALGFYGADWNLIALESAKGIWSAVIVLIVIWPAILIFEVTHEAKAFDVFRKGMQRFTPNELLQIIALGWVFVSFLQGITGFGVPVAVGAPLLVGIGVTPLWAVVIPLLGHAWANTFGTLSVAWQALISQTGLTDIAVINNTALWAGIFIWIFNFITGIAICWFYGKGKAVKKGFPAVLTISLIQGGGQLVMTQINQTLAAFLMTCIALGVVFFLGRTKWYKKPWMIEDSRIVDRSVAGTVDASKVEGEMTMHQAFIPYYTLTGITLFILLIKPVKSFLGQWKIGLGFPETKTAFAVVNRGTQLYSPFSPFTHAGIFLLIAAVIGFFYFRANGKIKRGGGMKIFIRTLEKTVPSTIAVVGLIIMSKIMGGTGQTTVLAEGTAKIMGRFYALLAPAVGVLGSFMTSSNMASNILFGEFQQTTARILNLNQNAILGAQTAGGAIGNTISPGNVILGTTTAGILGKEGLVLKKILPIALASAAIAGLVLFVTQILI